MHKLHFGCFDQPVDDWLNTDITPHIWISRIPFLASVLYKLNIIDKNRYKQHQAGIFRKVSYMDITKRFPYADDTFECAFSSHVLEHLRPSQAEICLREVYRVLKPNGILRIAVPDLDQIIKRYDPIVPDDFVEMIFEGRQSGEKNRHHWMYNEISLQRVFELAGFREITRCKFKQGGCPDVAIIDNRPDSLVMEGTK
jgi:SAM-dependent methyltransferase